VIRINLSLFEIGITMAWRRFCILCCVLSSWAQAEVSVAVPQDVLNDYTRLLAGRAPEDVREYGGAGARRDTVEVILFQQALRLGGYTEAVRFVPVDSYQRNLVEVESGRLIATATTVWAADVKDSAAQRSAPMIQNGEYVVGFYTGIDNRAVQKADFKTLKKLRVVTNRAWKNDVAVLESLGIAHIDSAPTFSMIARMVVAGRGDFMMASFKSTPNMIYEVEGLQLMPVQGLKVALPGSRHFLIAPTAQGNELLQALNKGIAMLRKEGRIRRAYTDAGFFNSKVDNWQLVNPKP
jgi:hypothetical protein